MHLRKNSFKKLFNKNMNQNNQNESNLLEKLSPTTMIDQKNEQSSILANFSTTYHNSSESSIKKQNNCKSKQLLISFKYFYENLIIL